MLSRRITLLAGISFALSSGILMAQTEDRTALPDPDVSALNHSDCPFFGPQRERFVTDALRRSGGAKETRQLSRMTQSVSAMLGYILII